MFIKSGIQNTFSDANRDLCEKKKVCPKYGFGNKGNRGGNKIYADN